MYTQVTKLYTLEEHLKHTQTGHISVYITPNGKIFDCRQNGVISHIKFTEEFYKNYKQLMTIHKDIDLNTDVSEFILGYDKFELKDIINFYLEQFDYVQYEDFNLYHLIKVNLLAVDNILVHDLGFVKVSINRGEIPVFDIPMPIFNGKKMTNEQYKVLISVLENNRISSQDFNTKRLIKLCEKEAKVNNIKLQDLKNNLLQYTQN